MKIFKSIGFCISIVVVYFMIGLVVMRFVEDPVWLTIIVNIIISIVGYLAYVKLFKKKYYTNTVFRKSDLFLFCGVLFVLWFATQLVGSMVYTTVGDTAFDTYKDAVAETIVPYTVLTLILAPIAEEILMRGLVFNAIKKVSVLAAYIVSALVFGLMHQTLIHIYVGFMTGLFFAIIHEYTGSLKYSIYFHSFYNFLSTFFGGLIAKEVYENYVFVIAFNVVIFICLIAFCIIFHKKSMKHQLSLGIDVAPTTITIINE